MRNEELRDQVGRLLGRIRTRADGVREARDPIGRLKGTYDPRTDQTRDAIGKLVGKGNSLSSLITQAQ